MGLEDEEEGDEVEREEEEEEDTMIREPMDVVNLLPPI